MGRLAAALLCLGLTYQAWGQYQRPERICSFNIKFLGISQKRRNVRLANLLKKKKCVIVVVQELVAPPDLTHLKSSRFYGKKEATFPGRKEVMRPDPQSTQFFLAMEKKGYRFVLSPEDTGPGPDLRINSTTTEYFVAFYLPDRVGVANDLPGGFLARDRSANRRWERVPYAFPFRSKKGGFDFVLVSVHLRPGRLVKDRKRRKGELSAIRRWIMERQRRNSERDYIVLGDMNIRNAKELAEITPRDFVSLNRKLLPTNTNPTDQRPYDHAMIRPQHTSEVAQRNNFMVFNLRKELRFKGGYRHQEFTDTYSDHHPFAIRAHMSLPDDD